VAFSLISGNTTTPLGMATVGANGIATVSVPAGTLPANLQVGNYQLVEAYSGDAFYLANDAIGTLTVTTAPTTVVTGNAVVTLGSTSPFTIPVAVNSPAGTVAGNVAVSLAYDNTTAVLTPAAGVPLSGGTASVSVTLPAGLAAGTYQLVETYLGNGAFPSSTADGTLTVKPPPAAPTSVIAGNALIGLKGGQTAVPVVVNSPAGTVNFGNVAISLVNGTTTSVVGSAAVSGGSASVVVTIPKLPEASYSLIEAYSDSTGHFGGSSAIGTLTVDPPSAPAGSSAVSTSSGGSGTASASSTSVQSPYKTLEYWFWLLVDYEIVLALTSGVG
jgi:hypothetical protein